MARIFRNPSWRIDWQEALLWFVAIALTILALGVIGYSLLDSHYGTAVTAQMAVVDKERVLANPKTQTYSYRADLVEDGKRHKEVVFDYPHWKQLEIGRTYRMNCIEGYYSERIVSCTP